MGRNIEIAVTAWTSPAGWRADELGRQAAAAETMGFHSIWLPENHFGDQRSLPAPLMLLAAAAACTERIGLGTTSYLLPIRHPLLAAEEVAVLDQLSGGRVILGIGRGIQDAVFRAFDLPASDKRRRFQGNLDIMRRAWRGEPIVEGQGGESVCLAPLPLQRPHPPLWVAAFGPLALAQAGSLGLPYLASPVESLANLELNYQRYHQAVAEAGLDVAPTIPVMRNIFITDDAGLAGRVRGKLQRALPPSMRDRAGGVDDWSVVGDRHYARDRLAEYAERLQLTHLIARGGLPGVGETEQQRSHECLLNMAGEF